MTTMDYSWGFDIDIHFVELFLLLLSIISPFHKKEEDYFGYHNTFQHKPIPMFDGRSSSQSDPYTPPNGHQIFYAPQQPSQQTKPQLELSSSSSSFCFLVYHIFF